MSADNQRRPDDLRVLAQVAGLDLPETEMARLATLYERFAADRARLTGTPAGETEPAMIFQVTRREEQP